MPSSAEDDSDATLRPAQPVRVDTSVATEANDATLRGGAPLGSEKGAKAGEAACHTASAVPVGGLSPGSADGGVPRQQSLVVGSDFGDYEVLEEIARGGMGLVVKARQKKLNRIVAVKMILSGKLADDADVQRFYTEAEASAELDHPCIVPIYEIGKVDGLHFYSMRYVDGPSLSEKVSGGPLSPDESARLTQQVAEAVSYAHGRGILHRDLKPANILLDSANEPLITDFGLAKRLDDDQGLTGTGQVIGTPGFMPPEQALGNVRAIGPASDIYSLGAILYCLLTGRAPFQAASIMETLEQVIRNEPVPPRQLNPSVPVDLETVCLRCLAKQATQRYLSAQDLADDLARFRAGRPVMARPVGTLRRFGRWCQRNPVLAALSVTAVVSLLAGSIVSTMFGIAAAERAREAEAHLLEAQRQHARAESNFKLARKAVDEYFTQVSENALLNQPGMQPLQQELLGQALRYYEQFLVEHASDPEIRDDLAGANFRVGLINETVEADPARAIAPLEAALRIQEQLMVELPGDVVRRAAFADTLTALGRLRFRSSGPESSLDLLRRALDIRQQLLADDSSAAVRRVVANSHMNLGLVYMSLGRFEETREQFETAQTIRRQLLESGRDNDVFRDLGMGYYNLGNLALNDPDAAEDDAFSRFQQATKVFEEIVVAEPRDFSNRSRLALCYRILGDLQSETDGYAPALEFYQLSRDAVQSLVNLNPEVADYREQLASLEMNRGQVLARAGSAAEASRAFTASLKLWSELRQEDAGVTTERSYAVTLRELALIESEQGEMTIATTKFAEAEHILRELAEKHPDNEDVRLDLEDTIALREQFRLEENE